MRLYIQPIGKCFTSNIAYSELWYFYLLLEFFYEIKSSVILFTQIFLLDSIGDLRSTKKEKSFQKRARYKVLKSNRSFQSILKALVKFVIATRTLHLEYRTIFQISFEAVDSIVIYVIPFVIQIRVCGSKINQS